MNTAYVSTAYLGPIQLYTKLFAYDHIWLETQENYLKQTYRNRCVIAAANGPQALTVPIVKPETLKCLTKDIRISDHGNWRHLHWNALVSAYRMSPFFFFFCMFCWYHPINAEGFIEDTDPSICFWMIEVITLVLEDGCF